MGYKNIIQLILDGELVNASTANRGLRDTIGNVDYVKSLVETALLGSTLYAREQTLDSTVLVGQPVFYNATTQRFERALAAVSLDDGGNLVTAASSRVWGLVASKSLSDKGDVLLAGVAEIDLSNAIDGEAASGLYFLSGISAGKLQATRPSVSIPVCLVAGEGETDGTRVVYVQAQFREALTEHRHERYSLLCTTAGEHVIPEVGGVHAITNPDPLSEGWLPADHAIFEGKAPFGAAFGYNLAVSPLRDLWPPIPVSGAYLEWNKGEDPGILGQGVPMAANELCVVDINGIWWMSNLYGDVPWPIDYVSLDSEVSDSSLSLENPREMHMLLTLWFTRPTFYNSLSCVQSLTAVDNSGLSLVCAASGDPAATGHLLIDFDPSEFLAAGVDDIAGHLAFKTLTGRSLNRGPVVSGIKSADENLVVSGGAYTDEAGYMAGQVLLTASAVKYGTEFPVETVRLDGAEEFYAHDIVGIAFRNGRESGIRCRVAIPPALTLQAGDSLKIRLLVLAPAPGNVWSDAFSCSIRRLPKPSDLQVAVNLPAVDTDLTLDAEMTSLTAYQYFEIETSAFEVSAGDTVFFTLIRHGDDNNDAYADQLVVVRHTAVLVAAE